MLRVSFTWAATFAAALLTSCRDSNSESPEAVEGPGRSALVLSADGKPVFESLVQLGWRDVAATARAAHASGVAQVLVEEIGAREEAPVRYLVGLLELSLQHPERAHSTWRTLNPLTIPGDHLYAPWRLAGSLHPGEPNPYDEPLARAVEGKDASALVQARFLSAGPSWSAALEAYLQSDPASWTRHDLDCFRRLRYQAAAVQDTKALLAAALRGGRVPIQLRHGVRALVRDEGASGREKRILSERLAKALEEHPELAEQAVAAAGRQLQMRVAFGEGRFGEVVEQSRTMDPATATDEAVLLTFLAASQAGEESIGEQWGQELRRRNPDENIRQWIEVIKGR